MAKRHKWITPESLAASVVCHLNTDPSHGRWVSQLMHSDKPLLRDFWFDAGTWARWLDVNPPPATDRPGRTHSGRREKSRAPLDSATVSVICDLIRELDHRVNRSKLLCLADDVLDSYRKSAEAGDQPAVADFVRCLRLWIAIRVWGGGSGDGRVPWNTRLSLLDGELANKLEGSVASFVTTAELIAPDIDGADLSYSSKWLWALGLANGRDGSWPRPYILDDRVRTTLGWLAAYERDPAADEPLGTPHGPENYRKYCQLLTKSAQIIRTDRQGSEIDGEKIEWLLFSSSDGETRSLLSRLPL